MKSDKELKQSFKIFIDENDIINLIMLRFEENLEDNISETELVKEELFRIFDQDPQKNYRIFVDMSALGNIMKGTFISPQARKISAQITGHKQIEKAAFVTSSFFMKTLTNFIIAASGKSKQVKGFSKRERAFNWLKK